MALESWLVHSGRMIHDLMALSNLDETQHRLHRYIVSTNVYVDCKMNLVPKHVHNTLYSCISHKSKACIHEPP